MKSDGSLDLHLLSEFASGVRALLHDVIQTSKLAYLNSDVDSHTHSCCFGNLCQDSFWHVHLEPCQNAIAHLLSWLLRRVSSHLRNGSCICSSDVCG